MTEADIKAALGRAVRKAWPNVAKASDLPFPEYWKSATDWIAFHAPHIGDKLIGQFIADIVRAAKEAEKRAETPASPRISDEVREIWNRAVEHRSKTLKAGTTRAEAAQDGTRQSAPGKTGKGTNRAVAGAAPRRPEGAAIRTNAGRRPCQGRLL